MGENEMKNMIVLKDLPSNIVDEAFVILKPNIKIKHENYVKKTNEEGQITTKYGSRDYMVQEAEMVISNYLSNLEDQKNMRNINVKRLEKKYKKIKIIAYILGITTFVSTFAGII